jgi:hypothetical protein
MKITMFVAWSAGVGVLVAAYAIWFTFLQLNRFSESIMLLFWLSPLIAASVASYFGPSKKILLGASMAAPAAILAVLFNLLDQLLGKAVDLPGLHGGMALFFVTLIYAGILSGIGGFMGCFLATKHDRNERQTRID